MAGQGLSRLKDLARVTSGVTLVFQEVVSKSPALGKLKSGDLVGSTTATLKFLQNTVADVTGLTRGRLRSYSKVSRNSAVLYNSVGSAQPGIDDAEASKFQARRVTDSQSEAFSSTVKDCHSVKPSEETVAEKGSPLRSELYGTTCVSRRDNFSPIGETFLENSRESTISSIQVSSNSRSGQASQQAAQVSRDRSEERIVIPSSREAAVPSTASLENQKSSAEPRQAKKRTARARRVPSTPFSRIIGFAGLGAGLAWGGVQESARRLWGGQGSTSPGQYVLSPFMTEQNAERIALALCRMRGAALKVGQMLSIQDESLVPAPMLAALERVRQGADVMPQKQLDKVLDKEFGSGWRERLSSFDDEPMAAASIGQVHRAVLKDGREVAMKVQYPGVASSIDSDIDNLRLILDYTNVIPKGLYLDEAMRVAKEELQRECDYEREAINQKRFENLLKDEVGFHVPSVVDEFSTKSVLTSELVPGVPIDQVRHLDQNVRNKVGARLLSLTLRELFVFRFMQTDPNWGNFLYDEATDTINLIDFGAARDFPKQFVDDYLKMVFACASKDREQIIEMSIRLGFLTGKEDPEMLDAHTEAAYATGESFSKSGSFDFRNSNLPRRVSELGAIMLRHRLTPPPDEAYSLHRKLSGAFLACVKLGAIVPCRGILLQTYQEYKPSEFFEAAETSTVASG